MRVRRFLQRRKPLMTNPPSNVTPLDDYRRAVRALHFFAALMSHDVSAVVPVGRSDLGEMVHLPIHHLHLAITRDGAPSLERDLVRFARERRTSVFLIRLQDHAEGLADVLIDLVLYDKGIVLLEGFVPAASPGAGWWLIGPYARGVHVRLDQFGPQPVMRLPWASDRAQRRAIAEASAILSAQVWRNNLSAGATGAVTG